jgi:hypothetical protein
MDDLSRALEQEQGVEGYQLKQGRGKAGTRRG